MRLWGLGRTHPHPVFGASAREQVAGDRRRETAPCSGSRVLGHQNVTLRSEVKVHLSDAAKGQEERGLARMVICSKFFKMNFYGINPDI